MVEEGFVWPGTMVVASDSHAVPYGAMGCLQRHIAVDHKRFDIRCHMLADTTGRPVTMGYPLL
jgi:homoaconitase/3-isopropylmalate dehydratase large subunit